MSAASATAYAPRQVIDETDSDSDIDHIDDSDIASRDNANGRVRQANISVEVVVKRKHSPAAAIPQTPVRSTLVFSGVEVPLTGNRYISMSQSNQRKEVETREDDNPSPKKRARMTASQARLSTKPLEYHSRNIVSNSSPDGVAASASPTKLVSTQFHKLSTNTPGLALDFSRQQSSSQTNVATNSDPVVKEAGTFGNFDANDDTLDDDLGTIPRSGLRDVMQRLPAANGHMEVLVSSRPATRKSHTRSPSPATQLHAANFNAAGQVERPSVSSPSTKVDGFNKQRGASERSKPDAPKHTPEPPEQPTADEAKPQKGRKKKPQTGSTHYSTQIDNAYILAPPPRRAALKASTSKTMIEDTSSECSESEEEEKQVKKPVKLPPKGRHSLPKYPEDRPPKALKPPRVSKTEAKTQPKAEAELLAELEAESELSEVCATSSPYKAMQVVNVPKVAKPIGRSSLGRRASAARTASFAEESESDVSASDVLEASRFRQALTHRKETTATQKINRNKTGSSDIKVSQQVRPSLDVPCSDIAVDSSVFNERIDHDAQAEAQDVPLPPSSCTASSLEVTSSAAESDSDDFNPAVKRGKATKMRETKGFTTAGEAARGKKKRADLTKSHDIAVVSSQTLLPFVSQCVLSEIDVDDLDEKVFVRVSAKLTEEKAKANQGDIIVAEELDDMAPYFWWPATIECRDRAAFRVQLVLDKAKTILQYHDLELRIQSPNLDKYHIQPLVDRKNARLKFKGPSDWLSDWANHAEQGDYNVPAPEDFKQALAKIKPTKRVINAQVSDDDEIPVAGNHSSPQKSPAKITKAQQSQEKAETTFGSFEVSDEDPELMDILGVLRTARTRIDQDSDSEALDPEIEVGTLCLIKIGSSAWPARVAQIDITPRSASKVRAKDGKKPKSKHGPYQMDVYPAEKKPVRVWRNEIVLPDDDEFLHVPLGTMEERGKDTPLVEDVLEAIVPEMTEAIRGKYAPAALRHQMFFKGQKVALADKIHYGRYEDLQVKQVQEYLAKWLKDEHAAHNAELLSDLRRLDDTSLIDYAINCLAPCALELLMLNTDELMQAKALRRADVEIAAGLNEGIDSATLARIKGHALASEYLKADTPWYQHILANRQLKESAVNLRKAIKMPSETWVEEYTRKRPQVNYAE